MGLVLFGDELDVCPFFGFAQRNDEATERLGKALEYFTSQNIMSA